MFSYSFKQTVLLTVKAFSQNSGKQMKIDSSFMDTHNFGKFFAPIALVWVTIFVRLAGQSS